jgi:hypothetical protein
VKARRWFARVSTLWAQGVAAASRNPGLVVVSLASGVGCASSPASLLPLAPVSSVVLVGIGISVALAGALASWWVLGLAGAISVLVASGPVPTVIGAAAFLGACGSGLRRAGSSSETLVHASVAALVLNSLSRSRLHSAYFFATSTVVAVVVIGAIVVDGLRRAEPALVTRLRRVARRSMMPLAVFVGVAVAGFALAAALAASDLRTGKRLAHQGLSALDHGDFGRAAELFREAHRSFADADAQLGRPWAWPAQLVPVVAQQADAAWSIAGEASSASSTIAATVDELDPDSVRIVDGRLDLDAVTALAEPFDRLANTLDGLRSMARRVESGWLIDPLASEMRNLRGDLDRNGRLLENARMAIDLAPAMLGADGPRTYLVLFTTPAEARGLGGFPGNFAEISADHGHVRMTRFGRWSDLESAIDPTTFRIEGPPGFIDGYGQFGFELSADGRVKGSPWRNLTMPPDFPTVAQVATELYPQSGGRHIDGVLLADVDVLTRLLGFTGPVDVAAWPEPIGTANARRVLLVDQYSISDLGDRTDFLSDVARTVIDRLLAGALPGPVELARSLGPEIAEGRLLMWTDRPDEQRLLAATRLIGAFPSAPLFGGADGFAVAITNVAGNKMDTFLDRTFTYETHHDGPNVSATLRVALTNSSPVDRLPLYVISNAKDLPQGTNRERVCVTSPLELVEVGVEGDDEVPWERVDELGGTSYCRSVTLPPGATVTLYLRLEGRVARPDLPVVVWHQPLVRDPEVRVVAS